ncbi:chaperone NapD [Pragia fontium]|uniref:Chaperone NapD n=2 Tax=Pragia fontium TaxID=82985 RepID=A0AAJ5BHP4_9GAMM|nr:chaperone NapD [Pragia fontium]GKX63892.1 nitrate reductase [Pragia fontium]SFD05027.1 periplasmic nitrate reductase chaperone NapD [Pragia fontium DSM 5563 = ATCC 49100]SUB83309.1 assembly protein for periplasmic nitrate reductase [Pragia fontium]VEJ56199.1 assembly protein for periplasmic nitrate reductase [Pragia fontium]
MTEKSDWHVCSLIVQVKPEDISTVSEALCALPGTEIPGVNEKEGKLIVVMQADNSDVLFAQIESARDIAGVLAVSLVYHQQDEQGEDTP